MQTIPFDDTCAVEVGKLRGRLLRKGISVSAVDLMIAAVAVVHNLTLVTHNTAHFQNVPNLRTGDWLAGWQHSGLSGASFKSPPAVVEDILRATRADARDAQGAHGRVLLFSPVSACGPSAAPSA